MDAGVAVFSVKGFHATRVDDIVKRAKTSHGTFYLYFASKDDLFGQLVAEVSEELDEMTRSLPVVRDDEEGRQVLEDWIRAFARLYGRFGALIRSWTDAEAPDRPAGMPDLLGSMAEELASKIKARSSKRFAPEIAALACVAMVERLNYLAVTAQVDSPEEEIVSTLTSVILDSFFGPGH